MMFAELSTESITALVGLLALLITTVAAYFKAKQAIEEAKHAATQATTAAQNTEKYHEVVKEYRHEVNSKLDILMKLIRKEGFEQGQQAEKDAQALKEAVEVTQVDEAVKKARDAKALEDAVKVAAKEEAEKKPNP